MDIVKLDTNPLRIEDYTFSYNPNHGCESIFTGYVRDNNNNRSVSHMEYTSHNNLALKIMKAIVGESKEKWGSTMEIILVHRLGKLNLGEISVYISVRAPHRDAAFSACRYLIEELKQRVPIWKKEYYDDVSYEWLDGIPLRSVRS